MSETVIEALGISEGRDEEIRDLIWGWIDKYDGVSMVLDQIVASSDLSSVEKCYAALKFGRMIGIAERLADPALALLMRRYD